MENLSKLRNARYRLIVSLVLFFATIALFLLAPVKKVEASSGWAELTQNGASGSPPARVQHGVVWDSQANRMLIFGGCCNFNDLWQYTSTSGWQVLTSQGASGSPNARWYPGMAWDDQNNRMLLFGGYAGFPNWYNDLWQYTTNNGWQQILPNITYDSPDLPTPRFGHSVTWDSQGKRLLVFGGYDFKWSNYEEGIRNDLWQYTSAGGWEKLTDVGAVGSPPPRRDHIAVWDNQANRLLVFGGTFGNTVYNDLWQYTSSGGWEQLTTNGSVSSPRPRYSHGGIWDKQSNRLIIFGGVAIATGGTELLNDLWQYNSANSWQLVIPQGAAQSPEARSVFSTVWDSQDNRMLVFGGATYSNFVNDLWQFGSSINTPPTADAGGPYSVPEGGSAALNGTGSDLDGDPLTYAWDLDNNGTFETPGQNVTFSAAGRDGPSSQTIGLQVCDDKGACATANATVNITNVAPTLAAITAPVDPVQVNTVVNASTTFTDPGVVDTHTALWNWGDETTSAGSITETNGSGTVSGSHIYSATGVYDINLTVTDKDGGVGQPTSPFMVVIYDSSSTAGFVTGSGIINSPAGAYPQDPSLTGRANFGFSVKYQPGDTAPNGGSQFKFRIANINFASTSYQWLAISGTKATFKGIGTNNGSGNYTFLVSTIDGLPDKYRIKIIDNTANTVFYDNEMGSPETADPTTPLVIGNIVIH